MGKGKKIRSSTGDTVAATSLPLDQQIERAKTTKQRDKERVKDRVIKKQKQQIDDQFIGGDLSAKILDAARKQKQQIEDELLGVSSSDKNNEDRKRQISLGGALDESDDDQPSSDDENDYDEPIVDLDPRDEEALERFMCKDGTKQKTLYDLIQEKIDQKRAEAASQFSDVGDSVQIRKLDPKLQEMYENVGVVLARYRSGKIPKAFKIIPKMVNWEQILSLTEPDKWTAAAMYQATRLFASNLNAKMCQRFYNLLLLPRIRDDIEEYKKLNFHLYQALRKSLYKPAAFFKGILLPLCESGTCTLREATIIGSVLTKSSVPMLHAAAAMLKIAEMDYTGANSLFLRTLIDKKYTLPYRAIDALVFHFLRFASDTREMPVLWHQALLALCQRYKTDVSSEQRQSLLELIKTHQHYQITPEIRRELQHAQSRDDENEANVPQDEMDFD
uniref:Bystin n=1 Tax=Plectus sambesii TaxID=2011161 RepID=A0A914VFM0_9BILA